MSFCIECVMAWLLHGDGAVCLCCRAPIYWTQPEGENDGHE